VRAVFDDQSIGCFANINDFGDPLHLPAPLNPLYINRIRTCYIKRREELEERKKDDPLAVTRAQLEAAGAEVARFDEIEEAVEREVAAAVEFAHDSPPALEQTMLDTVLVKGQS